jgi:hypothetical protein
VDRLCRLSATPCSVFIQLPFLFLIFLEDTKRRQYWDTTDHDRISFLLVKPAWDSDGATKFQREFTLGQNNGGRTDTYLRGQFELMLFVHGISDRVMSLPRGLHSDDRVFWFLALQEARMMMTTIRE